MKEITDPTLLEALNAGRKEITDPLMLQQLTGAPAAPTEEPSAGDKFMREMGLQTRAIAPVATGAAFGAALGAPFGGIGAVPGAMIGAGVGALAQPLTDVGVNLYNYMTGSNVPTPSAASERTMTSLGLPEPETSGERLRMAAARGAVEAGTGAGAAQTIARTLPAASTVARPVFQSLSAAPGTQAVAGAAGGATAQGLMELGANPVEAFAGSIPASILASRGITPFPSRLSQEQQILAGRAKARGIPLTPAEATGSTFLRDIETRLPMMDRGPQQEAINTNVAQSFGAKADRLTDEVFRTADARIGNVFDQTLGDTKLVVDTGSGFKQRINDIATTMQNELGADLPPKFEARVRDLLALPDNTLGPRLQTERTKLVKAEQAMKDPMKKEALTALREQLDDVIESALSPENVTDWRTARAEFRNLNTVMRAMGTSPEAVKGNINTQALANELQRTYGKSRYQRGMTEPTLQEVSDIGQSLFNQQTDLSAAQRVLTGLTLGGVGGTVGYSLGGPVGATLGAAATPAGVSAAYNNPLVRRYLQNQVLAGRQEPAFLGFSRGVLGIEPPEQQ